MNSNKNFFNIIYKICGTFSPSYFPYFLGTTDFKMYKDLKYTIVKGNN